MPKRTRLRKPKPAPTNRDDLTPVVQPVLDTSGHPLDTSTRAALEPRFGHDFSQVRVHTGAEAAASAQALEARAYTVGADLVFDTGQYAPATPAGRSLIAHELAHVVQQTGDANDSAGLALGHPASSAEQTAGHAARQVVAGSHAGNLGGAGANGAALVQRQPTAGEPDEPPEPVRVRQEVDLIPQPGDTSGWAATLAMVAATRDSEEYSVSAIAQQAAMDLTSTYDWNEIQDAATTWQLQQQELDMATPTSLGETLDTSGPLGLVNLDDTKQMTVIGALQGDGTPEGTEVTLYNPQPENSGLVETKKFTDVAADFGLDGAATGAAIIHE